VDTISNKSPNVNGTDEDDVGVIVESAATINARENSREFSQGSATTPGESVYFSDEEPEVIAQSREVNQQGAVYRPR